MIEVPESSDCEYKEVYTPSCLKTVSAFANYLDGRIIFGIKDDRTVLGVENVQQLMLQVEHAINDEISPRPSYTLSTCTREGCQLVVLSVCKGLNPPYYYQNRAYMRSDTSTAPVDAAQLRQLVLQGCALAYEELPASKQDLSFKQLEAEFQKVLGIEALNNDLLKTLGLVNRQGYTYAGQLLSDSPGPYHASLDIARFGESSSIFLHRESLEDCSVLYQYHRVLELLDAWYAQYEQVSGFYREKRIQIPREACREALVNALVHRDYSLRVGIRVAAYPDRLEITSPGGLPSGLSLAEYLSGRISVPRNAIVAQVFHRLSIMERFATGVRRIQESYRDFLQKPSFLVTENTVTVVLPKVSYTEVHERKVYVSDRKAVHQRVLSLFFTTETITRSDVEHQLGISATSAKRVLAGMVQSYLVKKEGVGPATRYRRM